MICRTPSLRLLSACFDRRFAKSVYRLRGALEKNILAGKQTRRGEAAASVVAGAPRLSTHSCTTPCAAALAVLQPARLRQAAAALACAPVHIDFSEYRPVRNLTMKKKEKYFALRQRTLCVNDESSQRYLGGASGFVKSMIYTHENTILMW